VPASTTDTFCALAALEAAALILLASDSNGGTTSSSKFGMGVF